jgi:outer membrane protein OmpA-like peptidoglycan-associated protein
MKKLPVILIASLCIASPARAAEDCQTLDNTFRQSLQQSQLDTASAAIDKMAAACSQDLVKTAQRQYSDALAGQANDWLNQGRIKEAEALLNKAKTLSWAVSSVRGDIAAKQKNWKEAAQQYGLAFELATDPKHVDASQIPNFREIQQKLYSLATDAQLEYGKMDASIRRGGEPAGILTAQTRGFSVGPSILPVHFESGKASLTPEGKESAEALASYIRNQAPVSKVILYGYADPRGSLELNQSLSVKRAEAVADFLRKSEVGAAIEVQGKGSTTPPNTLLENLTKEEEWQRWRRVELELVR